MNIQRKITNALILASLLAGSMSTMAHAGSQTTTDKCGVGYVKNAQGKCINVTTQRTVVSNASKKAYAYAMCLTNTPNWTPAKQKSCMRAKGYK